MEYKKFSYKNNKNCSFRVGNYLNNKQAMAIEILDDLGDRLYVCTVNKPDYFYEFDTATIKNYSENTGMTKFLKKLGVIDTVYSSVKCNPYAQAKDTIDYCAINIDKLKEYSSEFEYEFGF